MTGSSQPNPPIEERLDQLLDDMSTGINARETKDPEFSDFTMLATAIKSDDDVDWPEASFPAHLADALYAELGSPAVSTPNGHAPALPWDEAASDSPRAGTLPQPVPQMPALVDKRGWPGTRRILGIAAAIAGFGLLTLVLIAIFRGFEDDSAPALGGSEERHPQQLAVTMQTEPLNGNPDIFLVSLDGSEPVNLTNHPANDAFPAWSPDGSLVAFVSDRSGADALYFMNADGGDLTELYGPSEDDDLHLRNPVWSPDGDLIALTQLDRGDVPGGSPSRVVVIDVKDGAQYVIDLVDGYAAPGFDQQLTWSPDSRWLIFEAFSDDDSQLFVSDVDTAPSDRRGLQVTDRITGSAAGWSNNDEVAITDGSEIRIVGFDSETGAFVERRRIGTETAGTVSSPSWSPDGSHVAVTAGDFGGHSVWIVNIDDSILTEIPGSTTGVYPVWSDAGQLAYLRAGMVFSAESTGYELTVYDPESASVTHQIDTGVSGPLMSPPAWRPGGTTTMPDQAAEPTPTEIPATPPAVATATAIANQELVPPQADLQVGANTIEGKLGSYSWQFSDPIQTTSSVVYRHMPIFIDAASVNLDSALSILIHGDEYSRPPNYVEMRIHQIAGVVVAPGGSPDTLPGSLAYRLEMRQEPVATLTADDPTRPEFEPDLPLGNYVLFVEASWGPHPQTGREIFVTWIFEVTDGTRIPPVTAPALVIKPVSLSCQESVTWATANLPANSAASLLAHEAGSDAYWTVIDEMTTGPNGELSGELSMSMIYPGCDTDADTSEGINIEVVLVVRHADTNDVIARATTELRLIGRPNLIDQAPDSNPAAIKAIAQARAFLNDSEAAFSIDSIDTVDDQTTVVLSRPVAGRGDDTQFRDLFIVDATNDQLFVAELYNNTTLAKPPQRIEEAEAQRIAEEFLQQHYPDYTALSRFVPPDTIVIAFSDERYDVTWGKQVQGVWLPTTVKVGVDLDTGLVVSFSRWDFPYAGSLNPTIQEAEARTRTEQFIRVDDTLDGARIDNVRLAVVFTNFYEDIVDGRVVRELEAQWRLTWEFELTNRPSPDADDFIWIDASAGDRLIAGG